MASPKLVCANWHPDHTDCKKVGKYTCKNCYLVNMAAGLGPRATRTVFVGGGMGASFGKNKYLWGNVPAIDILQLGPNEGKEYDRPLRILFAASGDLRNLVKTIAQLLSSYNHFLEITLHDLDFDVVARNVILPLLSMTAEEADEAVDNIIHLWYSAFMRESDIGYLQRRVHPLVEDVFVLKKLSWDRLLSFIKVPAGPTVERARAIRAANTLAESRRDYRDRHMCCLPPSHRIAFNKFREDGLLLPFGHPRHEFQVPNPTFFQTHNSWPMKDDADPRSGWSPKEVSDMSSGPATADLYGKLFLHIRGMLQTFLGRLSHLNCSLTLFQLDASRLPGHLISNSFSRIEVSNISDAGYLGIHEALFSMLPLLQTPLDNPHATLITLFMNAVEESLTIQNRLHDMATNVTQERLLRYLPSNRLSSTFRSLETVKLALAYPMVTSYDYAFDRYSNTFRFREFGHVLGAAVKERHTIVDKWPFRLKLSTRRTRGV
ncbi:DUF4470 domain-containing protein [Aspergillus ibericus CBS 121593]|uniref:DUF4470 domain-containing protein n=1 Tax=Aspergillus ibericus CBS 121593 TaxID=1448316 RepID=A0A395GL04_9EURO|nr:hypothetical protein BO80DRAFT_497329 [Aspergillus ibericus CBS 121593]RAK96064.1 hypothetical protein BO80DRAFT_497329 [Aspergillus ibericus CBS 121593]